MTTATALIAGELDVGVVLEEALLEEGVAARFHPAHGLSEAFPSLEDRLEKTRHSIAVAVGTGDEALAIAITAAKLGIPVAAVGGLEPARPDAKRALATLAGLETDGSPARAAGLIAAWLRGERSVIDLD